MSALSALEFARLDRFLRAHENRFALALVRIPQIPLREEFARQVEEFGRQHQRPFQRFDFAGMNPVEVWVRIEAGLPPGTVAMLDGLDAAFHEPDGDMASLLNRQRERIAELLPGPVLFVLGERAMNRFVADAPDLADWYVASFEFETAGAQAGSKVGEIAIPERSGEWIEARIALLQSQLQGILRDRTRANVLMELADLYRDSVYGVPSHPDRPRPRSAPENLAAAEAALREAVDLQRQLTRQDSSPGTELDLARALNDLARLLDDAGRYAEAEPLAGETLRIRERVLGREVTYTLSSVNNLGGLYESQGRYAVAEPLYQRALSARERVLGAEHPATLTSVNNLAYLYARQGRYAEAEPLYRLALAARERVLGGAHPDTLTSVNNLAGFYVSQERYAEAEPLYQRALATRERVLGGEHPDTLTSVNNLAGLFVRQGRYAEAEPLYQRAVSGTERVLGHEHPSTQRFRSDLEALRSKMSSA